MLISVVFYILTEQVAKILENEEMLGSVHISASIIRAK